MHYGKAGVVCDRPEKGKKADKVNQELVRKDLLGQAPGSY